jgi:acyl carrier protein phosphodiesterase
MGGDALRQIDNRAKAIQQTFDIFWHHAKEKGWFDNKPLHEYLMYIEHEVSRNTWHIERLTKEIRDAVPLRPVV